MFIRNLSETPFETIVNCLLDAFEGYFVKMPADLHYWQNRFNAARVDWELSFGMFSEEKLVGFIINGIDFENDELTAFNTGTGVIPAFRGKKMVDQLYAFAIPELKKHGVEACSLEVIQKNEIAIAVYKRIGFSITADYKCFRGKMVLPESNALLTEISADEIFEREHPNRHFYSWDHRDEAINLVRKNYRCYDFETEHANGFFILNPENGYLAQFEVSPEKEENELKLLAAIRKISPEIRINNVDSRREMRIASLLKSGLENHIDQFQMRMKI